MPLKLFKRGQARIANDTGGACSACGRPLSHGDAFCSYCGHVVESPQAPVAPVDSRPPSTASSRETAALTPSRRRIRVSRVWVLGIGGALLLAALTAAGALGYQWQREIDVRERGEVELAAAIDELKTLTQTKETLEGELAEARELASRQGDLLERAQKVLRRVEPLLSSVDELQGITGRMQDARESYASASETLKTDLISLANYLLDVNPYYIDLSWVNYMIDEINSEISTVNYYGSTLYGYDGDYVKASDRFTNRANGFTTAVRGLQRQLQEVDE